MSKKTITLKGTPGKNYNLDELANDSRDNSEAPLIVQIYNYKKNENPNPTNLQVGQIWLSRKEGDND